MGLCRKELLVTKGQLARWKGNIQIFVALGMEVILLIEYLWGCTDFGIRYGTKITPCVLIFLFQSGSIGVNLPKVMIYLGFVVLLSDVPFMDEATPYVMTRSKRGAWWRGECIYIWMASFLYMAFITIVSILLVLPTVTWNGLWGSTIVEAVKSSGAAIGLRVEASIVQVFYPSATLWLTFLAGWLSMSLLGHMAYAINLLINKKVAGIAVMVFFILLDPIIGWLGVGSANHWMHPLSPVSWSSMEYWKLVSSQAPLETGYVFRMYGVLIVLCVIVIAIAARRKQIEVDALQ